MPKDNASFSKVLKKEEIYLVKNASQCNPFQLAWLDKEEVLELAVSNKLAAPIAFNLAQQVEWEDIPAQWRQVYDQTDARISAYLAELDRITEYLAHSKVAALVLENGALARAIFPHPGLYAFGDFDLLVSEKQLSQIHPVMVDAGYDLILRSNARLEYRRQLEDVGELRLNFQTGLVARRWIYTDCEPDFETLLARSLPVLDSAVRILGSEDFLYQLCIHNASHAYVRKPGLRLHLDVDWYLKQVAVNWPVFLDRVNRFDVATRVYYALVIPKALFDTPIPDNVLRQLRPPAWKERLLTGWIQRAGLFNPHERKFSRAGYILFTALLYDDLRGLWRAVFPDKAWMQAQYRFERAWQLPYYHAVRIGNLLFRRLAT